jgi:anaerobic magnesium-protoporphyrin IX monomethyl ester cyclase
LRFILIFSPIVDSAYIPLGIAQLKSYIEKQLPFVEVLNLDLNIRFCNNLATKEFLKKCKNLCSFCPQKCRKYKRKKDIFNHGAAYKISTDCLKDEKTGDFYDIRKYNSLLLRSIPFLFQWRDCINFIGKEAIEKKHCSSAAFSDLFKEDMHIISQNKPDLVGFSIFCAEQLIFSVLLAKIIKEKLKVPIIFGGAFMSHVDIKEFFSLFDFIDFVINKEGEIGTVEFLKNYKKGNFDNVPGLFYRKKGVVIHNRESFIGNLDIMPPPDFTDFDLSQYLYPVPVLPVIFSRGCFWKKCTYCAYYKNYPFSYKTKSIAKFIAEVKYYITQGVKHFLIVDDVISAMDLNAISTALNENKMKIFFGAIVRPERAFTPSVLRNIYSAGGRVLKWGVESSCQRILDLMRKGTRVEHIKSILKSSGEIGFHNHLFMISGFPSQTEEEAYKDLKFLVDNQEFVHSSYIHKFLLLKNSYIFNNPGKFKIRNLKERDFLHIKNKAIFHSELVNFERDINSNEKKIPRRMMKNITERLENITQQRYVDFTSGHLLIHAGKNHIVNARN